MGQRSMDSLVAMRVTVAGSLLGAKPPEYCTVELSLESIHFDSQLQRFQFRVDQPLCFDCSTSWLLSPSRARPQGLNTLSRQQQTFNAPWGGALQTHL